MFPDYPLRFEPIFMERIWGGRRIETVLGKALPPNKPIGESWEISDQGSHSSVVANGPQCGSTLRQLMANSPEALLGRAALSSLQPAGGDLRFPLLVKWIDAHDKLSIQVHPRDGHPRLPPGESGKTECWFIADTAPGAEIYVGLRRGIDRQLLEHELARGTVDKCLNTYAARPGDFYFVPAGTPHAIGAGVLLTEIQQTSDTTFRLFDWNRVDPATGRPRTLHVAAALDSIDLRPESAAIHCLPDTRRSSRPAMLLDADRCPNFVVARRLIQAPESLGEADRFHIIICLSGSGRIEGGGRETPIAQGDCLLIPASGPFRCHSLSPLELLDTWVP
jgi:mannose-6-phosphate isomerase